MVNNILEEIEREYRITRQKNEQKAKFYLSKALLLPDFKEVESKLKSIKIDIAKAEFFELDTDKALKLKEEQSQLLKKRTEILNKANIREEFLKVTYTCKDCKDTGFLNNKPCHCFNEKWKRLNFEKLGISPVPDLTFKNDTASKTEKLTKTYEKLKKYVEKFPNTNVHNFLFTGTTGCGKTYLASMVAGEISKKGYNTVFLTATELNQLFHQMHCSPYSDRIDYMNMLIRCDFLVIDDLGTENRYNNVTVEYFLALISERLAKNKHTIVTTNLTQNEIMDRYNERFFSRITEKKTSAVISFEDINFRTKK